VSERAAAGSSSSIFATGTTRRWAVVGCVLLAACDPVLNVAGANFPAWLVCALGGAVGAAVLRPVFVAARVEPYLWPVGLVYASLAVAIACVVYLVCFNRV
jgi:hypothetical protein